MFYLLVSRFLTCWSSFLSWLRSEEWLVMLADDTSESWDVLRFC